MAFSFGKGAFEEVARAKLHEGLDIDLLTIDALVQNVEERSAILPKQDTL